MTQVERLPIDDPAGPLDQRLKTRCEVMQAAGFHLAAMTCISDSLLLVFQEG